MPFLTAQPFIGLALAAFGAAFYWSLTPGARQVPLLALRELGYVYGIIGGAGPIKFYQKTVGASVIDDSEPGIYTDLLK